MVRWLHDEEVSILGAGQEIIGWRYICDDFTFDAVPTNQRTIEVYIVWQDTKATSEMGDVDDWPEARAWLHALIHSSGLKNQREGKDDLKSDLRQCIAELDVLYQQVVRQASRQDMSPFSMRNTNGEMSLAPIVVAKSNALVALASLEK